MWACMDKKPINQDQSGPFPNCVYALSLSSIHVFTTLFHQSKFIILVLRQVKVTSSKLKSLDKYGAQSLVLLSPCLYYKTFN